MLEVWGRKTSSNVQAVMWCVGELNLDHLRYDCGHRFGGLDTLEFLLLNPNGTIPVVRDDGGEPIWETGAIVRYLASRYGDWAFWPHEIAARTRVDQWAEWAKINVALQFTVPVFWQVVRSESPDWDAVALALRHLEEKLLIAETRLESHDFLAGDALTLADIQFGHVLYRYFGIDIPRPDMPNLKRYYGHLSERQAYRDHVMVSYDELRP